MKFESGLIVTLAVLHVCIAAPTKTDDSGTLKSVLVKLNAVLNQLSDTISEYSRTEKRNEAAHSPDGADDSSRDSVEGSLKSALHNLLAAKQANTDGSDPEFWGDYVKKSLADSADDDNLMARNLEDGSVAEFTDNGVFGDFMTSHSKREEEPQAERTYSDDSNQESDLSLEQVLRWLQTMRRHNQKRGDHESS